MRSPPSTKVSGFRSQICFYEYIPYDEDKLGYYLHTLDKLLDQFLPQDYTI
jgi:hypothetical protein